MPVCIASPFNGYPYIGRFGACGLAFHWLSIGGGISPCKRGVYPSSSGAIPVVGLHPIAKSSWKTHVCTMTRVLIHTALTSALFALFALPRANGQTAQSNSTSTATVQATTAALDGFVVVDGVIYAVQQGRATILPESLRLSGTAQGINGFTQLIGSLKAGFMLTLDGKMIPAPANLMFSNTTAPAVVPTNGTDANGRTIPGLNSNGTTNTDNGRDANGRTIPGLNANGTTSTNYGRDANGRTIPGLNANGTTSTNNGRDANGRTIPGLNANGTITTPPAPTIVTPVAPLRK